jgi:hypothetical protein
MALAMAWSSQPCAGYDDEKSPRATRQRYRGQRLLAGCNHEARARKMHTHLSDNGIATFDDDLMDGRGD